MNDSGNSNDLRFGKFRLDTKTWHLFGEDGQRIRGLGVIPVRILKYIVESKPNLVRGTDEAIKDILSYYDEERRLRAFMQYVSTLRRKMGVDEFNTLFPNTSRAHDVEMGVGGYTFIGEVNKSEATSLNEPGGDQNPAPIKFKKRPYSEPAIQSSEAPEGWVRITFDIQRDLKPAIMGMALGPADAAVCPRFVEVASLVSQIRSAYSARLFGESGTGKSICAYQVALEYTKMGWEVYRLHDSTTSRLGLRSFARKCNTFLLIDDAQLISAALLKRLEEEANSSTMLLSVYTESDLFARTRGAISIDARRAVNTIADAFSADLPMIGKLIRAIDNEIDNEAPNSAQIKQRIEDAKEKAQFPWQFCFMLSRGTLRARMAADSARSAGADIALAGAAINQIASDDAPVNKLSIIGLLPPAYADADSIDKATDWLVLQRLLISSRDLRCPHLRFAHVLLEEILRGQDHHRRSLVAHICDLAMGNGTYPFRGIGSLVNVMRTGGAVSGEWRSLLSSQSLKALGERCWRAETPNDISWAARILVELDSFIPDWFGPALKTHLTVLASWITSPAEPSGWGLADLLEHMKIAHKEDFDEVVLISDPAAIASAISHVKPDEAVGLGWLLWALSDPDPAKKMNARFREWQESFMNAIDKSMLMELAANLPVSECQFHFYWFYAAIDNWDHCLFLDLVERSLPYIIQEIHEKPFHALEEFKGCLWRVLGTPDLSFVSIQATTRLTAWAVS